MEESAVLSEKIGKQEEDIKAQTDMHAILIDQVEKGADRVEAIAYDTAIIKELFETVQRRAYQLSVENREMEADIEAIQEKVCFVTSCQLFTMST